MSVQDESLRRALCGEITASVDMDEGGKARGMRMCCLVGTAKRLVASWLCLQSIEGS